MAKLIREYAISYSYCSGERSYEEIEKGFFYQNDSRKPYINLGWGTNLKHVYVDKVTIRDLNDVKRLQRIF